MIQPLKHAIFKAATRLGAGDIGDTIVVTGSPRSGTTWLAELFRELPGYKILNEPLNLSGSVLVEGVEALNWRTYIPSGASNPEVEALLQQAMTGRVGAPHMWRFQSGTSLGRLAETVANRKLVVKLIRAGRMLSWVSERFPVRAIVSTFRHPCAVVASQLSYKEAWRTAEPPADGELRHGFAGELPDAILNRFGDTLADVDTTTEHLAALWSLDTYMTLQGPVEGPWVVTTYETLVSEATSEMKRILGRLGEPMPNGMEKRFDEPSGSASRSLRTDEKEVQLAKWRHRLTDEQAAAVLRIVHEFGLDFYTRSLRPDKAKLQAFVEEARCG